MRSSKTVLYSMMVVALLFLVGIAYAEEAKKAEEAPTPVTGTITLGVFNKYIYRGYELSRDSIVIQPAVTLSYNGFSATVWGNLDTAEHETQNFFPGNEGHHKKFNESDWTLNYTYALGKVGLTGGYTYYATKYANETEELWVTASYDMFLKPTLAVYQDINAYPGTYLNFSLVQSFPLPICKDTTIDLGASAGYQIGEGGYWRTFQRSTGDYTGSKYSAFHDGMVKVGFTIPLTKRVTLQPIFQYWFPLSGKAKWKVEGNSATSYNVNGYIGTNFVGGANINFNF